MKKNLGKRLVIMSALVCFLIVGFAGSIAAAEESSKTTRATSVTSVRTLFKTIYIEKGKRYTLPVMAYKSNGGTTSSIKFTTSKKKVVKVVNSKTGRIKALKKGTAYITAKSGSKKVKIKIKVVAKKKSMNRIRVSSVPVKPQVGTVRFIKTTIGPTNTTRPVVRYTSSDPSVVSIDKIGRIKTLKEGKSTLTISASGMKVKFYMEVVK